jgi:thioredoxin-like negative regulator of GroEL
MMLGLLLAGLLLSSPTAALDALALRLDELAVRDARMVIEATGAARPVVILFADRHCYPCLQMVEVFVALRERPPQGIVLFLVDSQRADPVTALLLSRYGVWAVPMTVLVDRSGRVARKLYGYHGLSTLAAEVDRLAER